MIKKILALDLGITSFGYAVLEVQNDHSYICLDNSIIMRDAPYDKDGNSNQTSRREQKSQRELIQKRKKRIKDVARVFEKFAILDFEACLQVQKENKITDKWRLRAEDALLGGLAPQKLFAIMAHMAKHRGYKSIATDDLIYELERELGLLNENDLKSESKDDEKRQVYAALGRVEALKKEYPDNTIAQILHRAVSKGRLRSYRNHDDYEKMIRREDIEEEIETIVQRQCELGGITIEASNCKELAENLQEAITDQIMPENDPSLFGKCAYYSDEIAAPKYSYLYDLYRLYKVLSDLKIDNYTVTQEDREKVITYLNEKVAKGKNIKHLTYKEVRKILSLSDEHKIYGKEDDMIIKGKSSARTLIKFFFLSEISKFSELMKSIVLHHDSIALFAALSELVREHKAPKPAFEAIISLLKSKRIEASEAEIIELIKGKKSGTLSVSHLFIIDALPHLKEGKNETDVKEILGVKTSEDYSHYPKSLKNLHLGKENLFEKHNNTINNHAVKSLTSWALQRIADLSWRYGSFDEIILESARDALPQKIKDAIDKSMREREKQIDKIMESYQKEFPSIDRKTARKIKLLESQRFIDLYTGAPINISDLFEGRADIEHIVPRSLGGLNAEYNLIIAHKDSNMQKSNRLPIDWLNEDTEYFNRIEQLFKDHSLSWKKRKNLLARSLDESYIEAGDTKSLRATSYLEALIAEILKMFYPFPDKEHRKNGTAVRNIPGKTTSRARSLLGIKSKSRNTNFHHAEDALILATLSRGWQNRLHRMLRDNYGRSDTELKELWQKFTPHIEGVAIADYIKEAYERFMSMDEDSVWYRDMFGEKRSVSFWVNKKPLSTSSHKATVYSDRHKDPTNPSKILPTLRKNILQEFTNLKLLENRTKWSLEEYYKTYETKIKQKLWLYQMGNTNDETYRAVEQRAKEIAAVMEKYQFINPSSKEEDELYKNELSDILNKPIIIGDKIIRKVLFTYDKLSGFHIDRGLVETDKNFLGLSISKGDNNKLKMQKIDINNRIKQTDSSMIVYLNEMVFVFNKKKLMHYGCLRSYISKSNGSKEIALFNPRFPANPKSQPKKFTTGSQIKPVSIGSATGIIKVHLDMSGKMNSYEKFGSIPMELEREFLKECSYGSVEEHTHY